MWTYFLGAEGPIQVTSGDPPGCAYLVGTLTKRGHLGPGHGECHCSRSKVRGRPAPLPEAVGWLAILSQRLELGLPGASRVPWSDLPRTSLGSINKASASVPSNHSMLLQVAVGTREFFGLFVCFLSERKKRERKIELSPVLACRSPAQPQPFSCFFGSAG